MERVQRSSAERWEGRASLAGASRRLPSVLREFGEKLHQRPDFHEVSCVSWLSTGWVVTLDTVTLHSLVGRCAATRISVDLILGLVQTRRLKPAVHPELRRGPFIRLRSSLYWPQLFFLRSRRCSARLERNRFRHMRYWSVRCFTPCLADAPWRRHCFTHAPRSCRHSSVRVTPHGARV